MTSASFDITPGAGSPFFDDLRQDKEIRGDKIYINKLIFYLYQLLIVGTCGSICEQILFVQI